MRFDPGDFLSQRGDPLVQLVDRQRVEVLLGELGQRIARACPERGRRGPWRRNR